MTRAYDTGDDRHHPPFLPARMMARATCSSAGHALAGEMARRMGALHARASDHSNIMNNASIHS